ncbi:hypothetical protein GGD72_000894 [Stenotrophomonas maltophilia]|uniref:hypothetical protein n=1 Tax=Stenotrophomonas maltophilia TaxID=40324 RepID=UPI00161EF9BA|nr:hypothetical protein [Stenotrophomonas maltophilia]MBB5530132.1 hypothetical protein [Stenotrophomonas maltophilia]
MTDQALAAFKHMSEHPGPIAEIFQSGTEYYFRYGGHSFSVNRVSPSPARDDVYSAFVYPGYGGSLASLAEHYDEGEPYGEIPLVRYGSDQPDAGGFGPVLARLYKVVADKYLNLDDIFQDVFSAK